MYLENRLVQGFRLAVYAAFFASLVYSLAAAYANLIGSGLDDFSSFVRAPLYVLPALVVMVLLYTGVSRVTPIPGVWCVLFISSCLIGFIAAITGSLNVAIGRSLPIYYIGDLLKFLSSWASFLAVSLCAYMLATYSSGRDREKLLLLCLVLALFDAFAVIGLSMVLPYWQKIHISAPFLIGYALFYSSMTAKGRLVLLALGIAAAVAAGKRAGLAVPVIAVTITLMLVMPRAIMKAAMVKGVTRGSVTIMAAIAMMCVVAGVFVNIAGVDIYHRFFNMYNSLSAFVVEFFSGNEITDQSMNSRFAERSNVIEFYNENPLSAFLGGGFGVETPMYNDTGVVSASGKMHHVHMAWWVYYLRNGVLGVGLLFSYFLVVGGTAYVAIKNNVGLGSLLLFMVLCSLAASYKSNIMLASIEFTLPILFGIVLADIRLKKWKEPFATVNKTCC